MSGVGAAAGFAYQHAQAVHRVLDLAENSMLSFVRVEAMNDVVDVETYTLDERLWSAAQFKRRDRRYTWGEAELIGELARWSILGSSYAEASYTFVTDGRLGPSGRLVQDALDAARFGDGDALEALGQAHDASLDLDVCKRATVVADTPGFDELIDKAASRAVRLFPNVTGALEAEERSIGVVLGILRIVVGRSGESDPDARIISRVEVLAFFSDQDEYVRTTTWSNELKQSFIEAIQRKSMRGISLTCLVDAPHVIAGSDEAVRVQLTTVAATGRVPLLSGPTGSGKSRVLMDAQAAAARRGHTVIVVDAESYLPNRLGSLIARGINDPQFAGAYSATGLRVLKDPEVTVVIDGVSEIPSDMRTALADELRQLLASDERSGLVLSGRDGTVLRSMLPKHSQSTSVIVEPLDRNRRIELLSAITGDETSEQIVTMIVAQVEKALGGAADNPQLFVVGAKLIVGGNEFTNPASMYRIYVRDMAEQNGYPGVTIFEAGLGIGFASLAVKGRRYCDSIEWTEELQNAVALLRECGEDITVRDLRLFGFESGLIVRSAGDTVRALHDSFADYLAAVAYWRKLSTLPLLITSDDRTRIEFYAELAGTDTSLATTIARDLPFMFPKLSLREKESPDPALWYDVTRSYIDLLWPTDQAPPRIAYWTSAGQLMVTLDGEIDGWVGERTINEIGAEALTFHTERGPLSVTARIWRHRLRKILGNRRQNSISVPATDTDTVAMLEHYSATVVQLARELIRQIAPNGHEAEFEKAIGAMHMQFLLYENNTGTQRDRRVDFRYIDSQTPSSVIKESGESADYKWTGRGWVDSFITSDARSEAGDLIVRAINNLAGMNWL